MALSQESQLALATLRARQQRGEELSFDDMKQAVKLMRDGREAAQASSTKARTTKAKAAPVNSDDLLSQLGL